MRTSPRHWAALLAVACLLAGVQSGCSTTSKNSAGKRYVVVCEDHAVTGSHIARPRCYRRLSIDERGEGDRETVRRIQQQGRMGTEEAPGDRQP